MSKILMDKLNNILDIDREKEYINFSLHKHLSKFINMNQYCSQEKLTSFVANNSSIINIIFNKSFKEILEKVKSINTYKELKDYLSSVEIEDLKINLNEILTLDNDENTNKKLNKKKSKKVNEDITYNNDELFLYRKKDIHERIEKILLKNVKAFGNLNRLNKKELIDTGKENLRIGFDFINGHINDVNIDAPLFLYDIEINVDENKVSISKKSQMILNEKLLFFIAKQLNVNYKNWDFSKLKTKQDIANLIEPIVQYKIVEESKVQEVNSRYQTLKFSNDFVIGLFDVRAGKIKEDFIELINKNVQLFNQKMKNDFEFYTKEEFREKALIQINNPLNIYQKYAIRSAINENTLIYGPPGTGKSEIITSILANLLIKSKSVLVVSEKDAALEVIKRRLGKLSDFAFYLKDIENENLFYEQIESISNHMGSFYNEEYRNEQFNLLETYQNNERVIDYNDEIDKFRNILIEDINFSLERDSRNNDYRDYLLSIREVEKFVKENKNGVEEFWKEYENKFVKLQSPTEFISKVAEFNWFKEKYELNEDETNRFDHMRHELNKFLVESNLIDHKIESFELLENKVNQLDKFINSQLLNKDKDFISSLESDLNVLSINQNIWKQIDKNLEGIKEKEYIKRFLLRYSARHEKFLSKYLNTSKTLRENLLNRYFYKGEISTSKLLFRSKKDTKTLDIFLSSIRDFEQIKLFKNNIYLNQLIELDETIVNPLVIYFYNNKSLLKKSFIEFYNQQIINFESRIIHQYYKYRVNQIERELININVYNFEKLNKNKHIIDRDLPYLINLYLKNNHDFILNMDSALYQIYLKHIKNILAKSSQDIQEKMEKMFKIARMELRPKINDFINEFIDCLRIIFPIWISKPELISFYLPNKKDIFDVGIFDEASQMFLEKAYPMIYRCNQLIISGDDKQLKPERILFNEFENDPDYRPLVKEVEFDYSESLLDRARVSYWNTYTLRNHYRSQAKELIEFSNTNFYDDKLLFTSLNNIDTNSLEIYTNLKNKEANHINKDEARLVLAKLKKEVNNFSKTLVICFTNRQKEYLMELINKEANSDLMTRIKRNLLVIGDISSVQGDEGDLVIISTVFSKESKDYSLIAKPRGVNYLNVAITRAKKKMIVFKSLNSDHINVNVEEFNKDTLIFKKWIAYLDAKAKIVRENGESKLTNSLNVSTFKKEVYQSFKDPERFKSISVVQNLIVGSINVDLALYTKSINDIDLLIILDDWKKNLTIQEWFEDIDKEEYLKSRNYRVIRIREQDWLKDKESIISRVEKIVKSKQLFEVIMKKAKTNKKNGGK